MELAGRLAELEQVEFGEISFSAVRAAVASVSVAHAYRSDSPILLPEGAPADEVARTAEAFAREVGLYTGSVTIKVQDSLVVHVSIRETH